MISEGECTQDEAYEIRERAPAGAISDELWMKYENKNDQTGKFST